jgi:hypothetical protein
MRNRHLGRELQEDRAWHPQAAQVAALLTWGLVTQQRMARAALAAEDCLPGLRWLRKRAATPRHRDRGHDTSTQ